MKNLSKLLSIMMIVLMPLSAMSCDDDNDMNEPETNTIADFVAGNSNYSSLLAALIKADLVNTLKGDGPFTVFAPVNAAFSLFLSANGFANLDAVPTDALKQILLNHVVSGSVKSTDLTTGYIQTLSTAAPNNINL